MKIILSNKFLDDFDNEFKKHGINHRDLISKIKQTKVINLKNPYFKIKIYINGISLRGLGVFNDQRSLIPIFFALKKDKKYGDNLVLSKEILEKLNILFLKYSKDFEKGNLTEF